MAVVLKAQVIVLVTTGRFTRAVRTFANGLASSSAQQAILVDRDLLKKYRETFGNYCDTLERFCRSNELGYARCRTDVPFQETIIHMLRREKFLQ